MINGKALKFTPLEFETSIVRLDENYAEVKIYSVGV